MKQTAHELFSNIWNDSDGAPTVAHIVSLGVTDRYGADAPLVEDQVQGLFQVMCIAATAAGSFLEAPLLVPASVSDVYGWWTPTHRQHVCNHYFGADIPLEQYNDNESIRRLMSRGIVSHTTILLEQQFGSELSPNLMKWIEACQHGPTKCQIGGLISTDTIRALHRQPNLLATG